jgi:diguanylate cyclase (GGDEF)-like protein
MNSSTHEPVSLRRTLLLRIGGLVAVMALVVAALFAVLGLRPMTERVVESQFTAAAIRIEASLATMFGPVEEVLRVSRGRAGAQAPAIDDPEIFNRQFRPVLETLPQVTSVVAGTSTGEGWMLLHLGDGRWRNRLTDIGRWGQRHLLLEHRTDGSHHREWREVAYDARSRPWYQGALTAAPGTVHWTAPYTLFTTGDPGISASTRTRLADGRDYVIGFDLMLRDLSRTTMKASLGRSGLALVVTDDSRVLALPAAPRHMTTEQWFSQVLRPAADLELPAVGDALSHWQHNGREVNGIIAFRSGGTDWLARMQPYPLGEQRLWVLALAPAADFAPDWTPVLGSLVIGGLLAMAFALAAVRRQARRIASPLESLAQAARQLAEPPAGSTMPTGSHMISEVQLLAASQAAMAGTIQRDQEQLASQADQLRRQLDEIRQLAYYDPLTGLPNRRLLLDRLGHALLAGKRSRESGALIMLDLDHFKILNDTQGHDAGDRLLVQVAGRLLACVRREDTVSRLGGDEYVVMLESLGDQEEAAARQAEAVAEKIRGVLNEPCLIGDSAREVHSSASLGVTLFGHRDASAEILLKQADMALYKAKDAGRNAIRFYNPAMQAAIDEHVRLEAGLRQALARGEFVLHYQPQVAGADGRIVAVEALVRWQHPTEGLVMPDRFIPVAEQTGLILPLGDWVIAEACRQLAAWKTEGIVGLRMAVNLSARQLHAPRLVADIQKTLADHGLAGSELELEVTESTAMQDPEQAARLLQALRGLGLRLAIDDFGTGYSSLSHLRRLPIQTLKLDRSFVRDLEEDSGDAAICAATISLARNLSLQVVAEGVETEAQHYFLSTVHRCDLLQGYLFGRPMPADELHPRLLHR